MLPPEDEPHGPGPKRVLILSGEMGEGHNAAAAALTEAIGEVWPTTLVETFDTLALGGPKFSKTLSWGYEVQMRLLPRTYEFFYYWLCRSMWIGDLSKSMLGSFFGRRLGRFLTNRPADLVISVYPFGSAALDWLRRTSRMYVPSVTYVPAFHVHPMWAYTEIDQHHVMYDTAPDHACTKGFTETMHVGAPPVTSRFGTATKEQARERLGLSPDAFIMLLTGGAWGLGGISDAVEALVGSDIDVQLLAVCGRSTQLLEHLEALNAPEDRLKTYGYVKNMHELMAAADVVLTNGAGVTVLEALRTPRPVIAFKPLAGHGKASTDEMMRRELALEAHTVQELVSVVRKLSTDQVLMARMTHAGQRWSEGRDLRESVREMETLFANAGAAVVLSN
ncbi:MAG: MGDG synthase family glycosyltransferase [Solirubrobacteraceae bacterium]